MVTQTKKILILTGSFGNGHLQVTQSIVNQFQKMDLDNLEIIEHDLFMEAHPIVTTICKNGISIVSNTSVILINNSITVVQTN